MPRPRNDSQKPKARNALIESFWELLAEEPFQNISVRELCRRAEVNKNTFYYHFENIEELAQVAVDSALFRELGALLLSAETVDKGSITNLMATPEMRLKAYRAGVLLSPNGVALRDMTIQRIINVWCDLLGEAPIEDDHLLHMRFLAGGLLSVLSGHKAQEFPFILSRLGEFEGMAMLVNSFRDEPKSQA